MAEVKYSKYQEMKIGRLADVLQILDEYPGLEFFRGQSDVKWRLLPKLSRLFKKGKIPDTWPRLESFILGDFKKYAVINIDKEPKNKFEWMVLGQHYGLPTRLLDWTTNPLKALYFAVDEYSDKRDGALFAFSPTSSIPMLEDDENVDQFTHMMPIFPNMIDSRIVAQEACFTIFPHAPDFKQFQPLEDTEIYDRDYFLMLKIMIPRDRKLTILGELDVLGVNRRTLFPDLSGLSDFISWKYRNELT